MLDRTPQFEAFVDRARLGKNGLGRLVAGILVAVIVFLVATGIILVLGFLARAALDALSGGEGIGGAGAFAEFMVTPFGLAVALLTLGGLWLGVWAAVRLIHKRSLGGVTGSEGRIDWTDFRKAFVAFAAIPFALQLATMGFDPELHRNPLPFVEWLPAAIAIAAILLVQTSAEEVFFRGYLTQSLAARFRSPWIWAVIPVLVFASLHFKPDVAPALNFAMLAAIAGMAFGFTWLVTKTGNLGAAMGAHFANNLVAILFVSHDAAFSSAAFFNGSLMQGDSLQGAAAALQVLPALASLFAALVLIVHPKSPLALDVFRRPREAN